MEDLFAPLLVPESLTNGTPNDDRLFGNTNPDRVFGYGGNDISIGYQESDLLFGNVGSDALFGNESPDSLYGGEGNDSLYGGQQDDILSGDRGDDFLSGDRGADILTGGEGNDRFAIAAGMGGLSPEEADRITDYNPDADLIQLEGGLTFSDVEIVRDTDETVFRDAVTGEYLVVVSGFATGVIEVVDENLTTIRLHPPAPESELEPKPNPTPIDNTPPEEESSLPGSVEGKPIIVLEEEIPQQNREDREVTADPGNTPEAAYSLAVSSTTLTYSEQVSSSDRDDYYVFSLGVDNGITIGLDNLSGNADLSLLDSDRTVIVSSENPGSIAESISQPLEPGTYYIHVRSVENATADYNLNVSVTPRLRGVTTRGSEEEAELSTNVSAPLINLEPSPENGDMEAFRSDSRFDGIDGSGYAAVIIDTGIDLDHPFFGNRIVYSYDFADNDTDASDRNGHGSNVSSIVASSDATYTGMAPGADIIHLKVFPDAGGSADFRHIEQALQWVAANVDTYNIVSVNMSLGGGNYDLAVSPQDVGLGDELAQIAAKDVIVVSSTCNEFRTFNSALGVGYPAADPNSLAVGAVFDSSDLAPDRLGPFNGNAEAFTADVDRIAPWSQRHPQLTDIFAPGPDSTGANWDGGTVDMGGTSQASPHIAGIAVLAQQLAEQELGRRLTFDEFRSLLNSTGVTINDGDDEDDNVTNSGLDYKRVDVLALGEAILDFDPPDPPPPDLVRYDFAYLYNGQSTDNDYYTGYVYAEPGTFAVGNLYDFPPSINNQAGYNGLYYIIEESAADSSAQSGTVYVTEYFDINASGQSYTPYHFQNGEASGFDGLGSEYDFAVINNIFDDFGHDFAEVNPSVVFQPPGGGSGIPPGPGGSLPPITLPPQPPFFTGVDLYTFGYYYGTGDAYFGYTYAPSGSFFPGEFIPSVNQTGLVGNYYIGTVYPGWGDIFNTGDVYVTSYFDGDQTGWSYQPYNNYFGAPSGEFGLGSEYDYIYKPSFFGPYYDDFGQGFYIG